MGGPPKSDPGSALRRALGRRIEQLRRWHGMGQEELATQLGVSRTMVTKYETGRNAPSIDVLVSMRRLFAITLEHLILGLRTSEVTDARLLSRLRRMDALPTEHKAELFHVIDSYLELHEAPLVPGAPARASRSTQRLGTEPGEAGFVRGKPGSNGG